ncbi:MAG: GTPase ObgE [Deltaproteobacteria bacterium]|nr:GTPase ObgE [Deltaproteobacteria bacterium]
MKHANLFVDEVEIEVRSGKGGDGIVAFRREKFVSNGGPNGGDGGRGGDIVLVADDNVGTLLDFKGAKKIKAANGQNGGGSDKKGASGDHIEVRVPVGTLVFDLGEPVDPVSDAEFEDFYEDDATEAEATPEQVELNEHAALADLTEAGQRVVVARGGRGGLGNARFKTSTRQAPDFATDGKPGERRRLRLSLKLMADVGLVGFPNAGKSTLLRRISAARPRVANYPFTTLVPSLGVVERDDQRIVVADIPGLIEGASDGAGLGHQFLRHVERTRVLIHLLDLEAMFTMGRDLVDDYDAIRRELGRYRPELLERKEIVVLSKGDLVHDDAMIADLEAKLAARDIETRRISAAASQGMEDLLHAMFDAVEEERALDEEREEAGAGR